nr:MAG TPA: hypothetical protein [Caudoviricetes sp.]
MEEKINIAEILKNKPQGTILYSPICGECKLSYIESEKSEPQISTESDAFGAFYFWDDGKAYVEGECLLFPSDKMRDWAKFSWKKGDVLKNTAYEERVIFDGFLNDDYTYFKGKHPLDCSDKFNITYHEECNCFTGNYRLESTDAAQTYINTLEKKLGGKLNRETLEIEKAQPEFKDGDIVFMKGIKGGYYANCIFILRSEYKDGDERAFYYAFYNTDDKFTIAEYGNTRVHYSLRPATDSEKQQLFDALEKEGKAWDAEKKQIVDIKKEHQFKPFEKVLVRDSYNDMWRASFFSHIKEDDGRYVTTCLTWKFCIPYIGNESLVGTTKDVEG